MMLWLEVSDANEQSIPDEVNVLSFALRSVLAPVHETQESNPFHKTGSRVAQKSTSRLECAIDSDMVIWSCIEVTRLGGMVGGLFRDVVGTCLVFKVPVARVDFAKDRVQRLLDASIRQSVFIFGFIVSARGGTNGGRICQPLR